MSLSSEQADAIKDVLFEHVRESDYSGLVAKERFDAIIRDITDRCHDSVISMGPREQALGVLATGILHYLLTAALIPSQRKVRHGGAEIDIVIPDVRTLENDPKRALVIHIAMTGKQEKVIQDIVRLRGIQPHGENIWAVMPRDAAVGCRSFVLSRRGGTFEQIIFEIARFANVNASGGLKVLRI